MKLISSYPRSGSSRLRFIICYLLYPEFEGLFGQMSRLTPSIDSAITRKDGIASDFMVTHSCIDSDIYLYRHVGDCLVSEYWFKQKYYPSNETLEDFIIKSNYGEQWRKSVEAGRASNVKLSFNKLGDFTEIWKIFQEPYPSCTKVEEAIRKSSFRNMQKAEGNDSFYYLPQTESKLKYMRSGKSGQWKDLAIAKELCRANESELLYLNLMKYDQDAGLFVDIE